MIRNHAFCLAANPPRFVILRASDEDARRISAYSVVPEFLTNERCQSEGNS
jgi:hypothetical protein